MAQAIALGAVLVATLVALAPTPAGAGDVKVFVNSGRPIHRTFETRTFDTRTSVTVPPRAHPHTFKPQGFSQALPHTHIVILPQPVYVVVASRCYVAGRWSYQWVPQSYGYNTWVPSQWSPEGTWIDGHYETRISTSGYYQPYWIEGGYADC